MIEVFRMPPVVTELEARILVQYDLSPGKPRQLPYLGHAYQMQVGGRSSVGRFVVKGVAGAPDKQYINPKTVAMVCDSEKELSQLRAVVDRMSSRQRTEELDAREALLSLAGITEEPEGQEDESPPDEAQAGNGGDNPRPRRRRRRGNRR